MFDLGFPEIKNVAAKSLVADIIPEIPRTDLVPDSVGTDEDGNSFEMYGNLRWTHVTNPKPLKLGDYGHSFGQGFFVVNEHGERIYHDQPEEYARICKLIKEMKDATT